MRPAVGTPEWEALRAKELRGERRYKAAHPDLVRDRSREAMRKRRAEYPEREPWKIDPEAHRRRSRESARRAWLADPVAARQKAAEYRAAHPEKIRQWNSERRARRMRIPLIVQIEADYCGICLEPLTGAAWPDPRSTSLGHEPPLSVAEKQGWLIVCERPEHLGCNARKRARLDCELTGALR